MGMKFTQLQCKEVICISTGQRLGFVADVEVEVPDGTVAAIIALAFLLYMMFRKNKYSNDHLSISAVDAVGNR